MKLTKEQRHMAYMIMLAEAETKTTFDTGLCYMVVGKLFGSEDADFDIYEETTFEIVFPELFNKQPKSVPKKNYWFSLDREGWDRRIALLKECIEETY